MGLGSLLITDASGARFMRP